MAEKTPEKIVKVAIDPALGLTGFQARQVAFALGLEGDAFKKGVVFLQNLYRLFVEKDCSMVEINPLVVTKQGEVTGPGRQDRASMTTPWSATRKSWPTAT